MFPHNWMALHERGYIYVEYGRWSDAFADLNAEIALNASNPESYRERALARFNLADLAGAYADRDMVIVKGSTDGGDILARARAAMWLGKFDAAAADIASAGSSDGANALSRKLALWSKNSGPDAAKRCVLTDMPGPDANPNLVGDCTQAFLAATTAQDRSAALTNRSAGWLTLQSDEDAWTTDLQIAAALDPANAEALSNLGYAYVRTRHSTAAAEMFDRSIAIAPSFFSYAGRASARFNLGNYDGAEDDARKSNALRPNDVALTILGDVAYARTKTYDLAKTFWIAAYNAGGRDDGLMARLKEAGVPVPPPGATSP